MATSPLSSFLHATRSKFAEIRRYSEKAAAQISGNDFFRPAGPGGNSVAILFRHVSGNLRSRFTDFYTSDGEKPDRRRDGEFEESGKSRAEILEEWNAAWAILEQLLADMKEEDLSRTVYIRGEGHTVFEAMVRQLAHYGYHYGQIVLLCRIFSGDGWKWLSIPPGMSEQYLHQAPEK